MIRDLIPILRTTTSRSFALSIAIVFLWVASIEADSKKPVSKDTGNNRPVSFRLDVLPILTKTGCNAGTCQKRLSPLHETADLIVIADEPEGDPIGQLEDDPIMDVNADLPDITMETLQSHSRS